MLIDSKLSSSVILLNLLESLGIKSADSGVLQMSDVRRFMRRMHNDKHQASS